MRSVRDDIPDSVQESMYMSENESSPFQSGSLSLEQKLDRARTELLDLTARNKLLNIPRTKTAKQLEIVDERSDEIYRLLVEEGKAFTFLPGRAGKESDGIEDNDTDMGDEEVDEQTYDFNEDYNSSVLKAEHQDTKLQTRLTPKGLQKRLLDLHHDSRILEEDQGVNILFLTLGSLKWIDPNNKENIRYAPIVLLPVSLERGNARDRFKLKIRQDEIIPNLSLETYLDRVHEIILPEMNMDDNFDILDYMSNIVDSVAIKKDWEVLKNDITLGFFSFSKFLMYRDLDPANWPENERITDQPIIQSLMVDGFGYSDDLLPDDTPIDSFISPRDMLHIMDSDTSQTLAIHDVRKGKSLVIQGPPGTGKSQTIANIIASAIADGKTVLFVAEKLAALEVVKRRLDQSGVGDACLELHSNKANKRGFLEELKRVWELGSPRGEFPDVLVENLTAARDSLNQHPVRLHEVYYPSDLSPYQVMGHLVRLRQSGQAPTNFELHGFEEWSQNDFAKRIDLVKEIVERITDIGLPDNHPWNGVNLEEILPVEVERLISRLSNVQAMVAQLQSDTNCLSEKLAIIPVPLIFSELGRLVHIAESVVDAPDISAEALTSIDWQENITSVKKLIDSIRRYQDSYQELEQYIVVSELEMPVVELDNELAKLPQDFNSKGFIASRNLLKPLQKLSQDAMRLHEELGTHEGFSSIQEIERLIALGERVSAAPNACPDAFIASVWDHGVEKAAELVDSIATFDTIYNAISDKINESSWEMDLLIARNHLASHTGIFRFFNSDWRKAKALVGSLLKKPDQTIPQQIALLDELIRGQLAKKIIKENNEFGRSAFGSDWRGEKSDSTSLMALVEWMRTLRGVGVEARLLAGRLADREGIKLRTQQLNILLQQVRLDLDTLWHAFGLSPEEYFSNQLSISRVPLIFIEKRVQKLNWIDEISRKVLINPPLRIDERSQLILRIIELQELASQIHSENTIGENAFGIQWKAQSSDVKILSHAYDWIEQYSDLRFVAAKITDRTAVLLSAIAAVDSGKQISDHILLIAEELRSKPEVLFGVASFDQLSFNCVAQKLQTWISHSEQLSKWVAYRHRVSLAHQFGLGEVVARLAIGQLKLDSCLSSVERTYFESLLRTMVMKEPELARFDGELHSRQVAGFADLDLKRIKAASLEVVRAHHRQIPSKNAGFGPIGILRSEMVKKRGHMPIRQLMSKAGSAIQALKPVMMMSPLSVAQFLLPGKQKFDLLVMDEASQIQPVDAIGAIARCKQVVVVGDERQLPPTRFFAKMTESVNDDDDDVAQVSDIESILGLFVARGLPQRMLRWHYRSRHESLIAVSNTQFYENKLFIVPSPYTQEAGMGLQFRHVPEGFFETGKGVNAVEAKQVALAIMEHARKYPEQSLGVATFSVSQRKVIQDELELLRRLNPDLEEFFNAHPSEPFFVKNLENVQGDERDVIMISVGYARNAQGYMAMRFGPLGAEGGERRLNVLISRAKRRCEVFASITDEDIDLERAKGKGVFAFKLFLQYARTGRISLAQRTEKEMDSIFEEQVANALQNAGYQVHPQVGIAGFFIDIGIADPEMPGRYLLGIECDGRAYHSSRSARERDRLRQAVLEDHGWIIHRIWSTDWFQRPAEQLHRTLLAIESAKRELSERAEHTQQRTRAVPVDIITVDRGPVVEIGLVDADVVAATTEDYIEATPVGHLNYELHETPLGILTEIVEQIIETESPVHFSEVITRIRTAWGLQRSGARIEAVVNRVINLVCNKGEVTRDGQFLIHQKSTISLRNRQNVKSLGLRKIEMLPPKEIAIGVAQVVKNNLGATDDEIVVSISRMLGFKSTSSSLRKTIVDVLDNLIDEGLFVREDALVLENKLAVEAE